MKLIMNKTCIGYNHIDSNIACQDCSLSYQDENRSIIVTCDGHGGKQYVRSERGSRFACKAVIDVFKTVSLDADWDEKNSDILKLRILSRWNEFVERDFARNPFEEEELDGLNENQKDNLKNNYVMAYGTTMNGALIINKKILCVSIGDGGLFLVKNRVAINAFEENEDENVANITCSLCSENAYEHIHVKLIGLEGIQCVICLTDGVVNPYQSYFNFNKSFVGPIMETLENKNAVDDIKNYIRELGVNKGIGDDVSIALFYDDES